MIHEIQINSDRNFVLCLHQHYSQCGTRNQTSHLGFCLYQRGARTRGQFCATICRGHETIISSECDFSDIDFAFRKGAKNSSYTKMKPHWTLCIKSHHSMQCSVLQRVKHTLSQNMLLRKDVTHRSIWDSWSLRDHENNSFALHCGRSSSTIRPRTVYQCLHA